MVVITAAIAVMIMIMVVAVELFFKLPFQLKIVYHDGTEISAGLNAFHAIIANLVWIEVAAVTLAAANALAFLEHAHLFQGHINHLAPIIAHVLPGCNQTANMCLIFLKRCAIISRTYIL